MGWKYWLTIFISMVFFISIIMVGTNISAGRLAAITNKEIAPPFLLTPVNNDVVAINILGSKHDYSLLAAKNGYANVKASIQNSYVAVKCNLIPRTDYLRHHWEKGTTQLKKDVQRIIDHF